MQLRHDIANRRKIDFGALEMIFDKTGQLRAFIHDPVTLRGRHVQQVSGSGFGNKYKPGHTGIFVEQDMAVLKPAQYMTICDQLLMYPE